MNKRIKGCIKLFKSKKGKSILFFSFYLIFFLFLFNYVEYNKNNDNSINKNNNIATSNLNKNDYKNYYETSKLENSNYLYKITIKSNDSEKILEGSKSNKENLINYEYYEFVDLIEIKRIIKNAKYITSTNNSHQSEVNYEIKTSNLCELFDKDCNNDTLNEIELTVNENRDLLKIELDFTNYLMSVDNNIYLYKVLIEYEYE